MHAHQHARNAHLRLLARGSYRIHAKSHKFAARQTKA